MHVPVQAGPLRQRRVYRGEEERGEKRGDDGAGNMVEERGEQELMDVEWKSGEREGVGDRRREFDEIRRGGKREGVEHGG